MDAVSYHLAAARQHRRLGYAAFCHLALTPDRVGTLQHVFSRPPVANPGLAKRPGRRHQKGVSYLRAPAHNRAKLASAGPRTPRGRPCLQNAVSYRPAHARCYVETSGFLMNSGDLASYSARLDSCASRHVPTTSHRLDEAGRSGHAAAAQRKVTSRGGAAQHFDPAAAEVAVASSPSARRGAVSPHRCPRPKVAVAAAGDGKRWIRRRLRWWSS